MHCCYSIYFSPVHRLARVTYVYHARASFTSLIVASSIAQLALTPRLDNHDNCNKQLPAIVAHRFVAYLNTLLFTERTELTFITTVRTATPCQSLRTTAASATQPTSSSALSTPLVSSFTTTTSSLHCLSLTKPHHLTARPTCRYSILLTAFRNSSGVKKTAICRSLLFLQPLISLQLPQKQIRRRLPTVQRSIVTVSPCHRVL